MVKPELGTKRVCPTCGIRFYDLLKEPIECPSCAATFMAEPILPSKNDAPPPAEPEKQAAEEEDTLETDGEVEVVSLEDVDEDSGDDTEDSDVAAAAEIADVDIDDDSGDEAGDEFLEDDDEESGDVSGIIGGVAPVKDGDT